ncbi:hypothetical protein HMPREF3214_01404 [Alloscardovia omnicolens]|nr:hypothetical protein HMPREF3214_01404 [Alloscardovia omnicolens]
MVSYFWFIAQLIKKVSRYAVHTITFRCSRAAHTTIRSIALL